MAKDKLGDEMPTGYEAWVCPICTAICNFEAMQMCAQRFVSTALCGFDQDLPESNGGAFGFMKRIV